MPMAAAPESPPPSARIPDFLRIATMSACDCGLAGALGAASAMVVAVGGAVPGTAVVAIHEGPRCCWTPLSVCVVLRVWV